MKRVFKFGILMAMLMIATTSCKEEKNVAVTGITLSQTGSVTLAVGGTLNLSAAIEPPTATQKDIVWTTSRIGVVTVKDNTVTALLPGTVTITATTVDGGLSKSVEVTVDNPVTGITFIEKTMKIAVGEKVTPMFALIPHSTLYRSVTWSTGDPSIAAIDANTGEISGIKIGETVITVTSLENSQATAQCTVEVMPIAVTGITLTQKTVSMEIDETKTLAYGIEPSNADDQRVEWSSENPAIASVDETTGVITAVSPGKVNIIATTVDGGYTDNCLVSVQHPNLVKNHSFEEGGTTTTMADHWTVVAEDWFKDYYGEVTNYSNTRSNNPGVSFFTGNGSFFAPYLTGTLAVRNEPSYSSGFYQIITVEPGAKYTVSADIGFRENSNNADQIFKDFETIKILSSDDALTTYAEILIPGNPSLYTGVAGNFQLLPDVSGIITIPAGVNEIRIQFDFRDFAAPPDGPGRRPLVVVDNVQVRMILD